LEIMPDLPAVPLGVQTRHNLFMAVKEALNNATKHSAAREIWLGVSLVNDQIVIIVADDGHGFDVAKFGSAGNGLQNLRKRLEEIGGACEIESRPGHGCRVRLFLPMPAA
jgi:signal transduction histidine kinase